MQSQDGTCFVLLTSRQAGELVQLPARLLVTLHWVLVGWGTGRAMPRREVRLCFSRSRSSGRAVTNHIHCRGLTRSMKHIWHVGKFAGIGYSGQTSLLPVASKQSPEPMRLHRGEGVSSHPGALKSTELARRSKYPGNLNSCRVMFRRNRTRSSAHQIPA